MYIDNILIFSQSKAEHEEHVQAVLEQLHQYSLFIKLSKCEFHVDKVNFLGFIIRKYRVRIDLNCVQAILDQPLPLLYQNIQVFLGFMNFYCRFICDYLSIVIPITNLLKGIQNSHKTSQLEQTAEANIAFYYIKQLFQEALLLIYYNLDLNTMVKTNTLGKGLRGVLSQLFTLETSGKQVQKPIAFFSKKLSNK